MPHPFPILCPNPIFHIVSYLHTNYTTFNNTIVEISIVEITERKSLLAEGKIFWDICDDELANPKEHITIKNSMIEVFCSETVRIGQLHHHRCRQTSRTCCFKSKMKHLNDYVVLTLF